MRRGICAFAALLNQEKPNISKMKPISNFKEWKFKDPPNYASLPIDENPEYNIPVAVKNAVFSKVPTEPLTGTLHLVCASEDAMKDILDLEPSVAESEEFINFVAGRYLPPGGLTVSHRYGGYQFGFWADQLGDGRAHILGEYVNCKGESWQPQLKGSGETPYSRFGDGRAVLRSSIREMVASEACHHLGIPTTRAAALVVSDEHQVYRDKTYSGRARQERCAVVMRLAPAWYRGGSVEILQRRKEPHTMRDLLDFIIQETVYEVYRDKSYSGRARQERCAVVMRLAPAWYRGGSVEILQRRKEPHTRRDLLDFIIQETVYQVYRDKTYSGRARQERCADVMRLAPAWYRGGSVEILQRRKEPHTMRELLDFIIQHLFPHIDVADEDKYVKWFSEVCHKNLDMVATWQGLGFVHGVLNTDNVSVLGLTIDYGPYGFIDHYYQHYVPNTSDDMGRYAYNKQPEIIIWNMGKLAEAMEPILSEEQHQKLKDIIVTLHEYVRRKVLQTYLRKLGLEEIQNGDQQFVDKLLDLMQDTMADFTGTFRQLAEVDRNDLLDKTKLENKWSLVKLSAAKDWEKWAKSYLQRLEKENVSEEERRERMVKVNPVYVPRNWILQEAIADAEKNDFEKVRFLLQLFRRPFEVNEEAEKRGFSAQPPSWAYGLKLSCSS